MEQLDKILSDIFIRTGEFSPEEMDEFTAAARRAGQPLNTYLTRRGLTTEKKVLTTLAEELDLPVVNLTQTNIAPEVVRRVPVKFAWYYKFMPLAIRGQTLTLAAPAPLDVTTQDEIRTHLGLAPEIALACAADVREAIKRHYGLASDTVDRIMTEHRETDLAEDTRIEELDEKSDEASVSRLVNHIILDAYRERATDIHIEPYRNRVRVRYRIDGVLVDANLPPDVRHLLLPMLSRIKIMANLNIVEKRTPQDGSMVVRAEDQDLDLRVSTLPTPRGESLVIRILPGKVRLFDLAKLGFDADHLQVLRTLIRKPHGIIFLTGPTGSGKTTTLYACLNTINSPETKIITLEDPVEYEVEGITQVQVTPKVGLTFASGLRNILRHDPDIIMVGEVRDRETADIAVRTALTGHLVFSTLHTNDAVSGVVRLVEMGVEPYLVASSVEAFVAQRLVRVICPHCKTETDEISKALADEIRDALRLDAGARIGVRHGTGCEHCHRTGFYGRTAIYEMLPVTDAVRDAILERPRPDHLREVAAREGMRSLRVAGWRKGVAGITTPAEVLKATG